MTTGDNASLDATVERLIADAIGENLDQLITMDMRGDGVARALMAAARATTSGALTLSAARALRRRLTSGDRVLFLTGFVIPPWGIAETDGLVGTVLLGRALEIAVGAQPVIVCEAEVIPPLQAGFKAAGLQVYFDLEQSHHLPHSVVLLPFPRDTAAATARASEFAELIQPTACIAIERPGRNPAGNYHLALGKNVTQWIAPTDFLFEAARDRGALTVAVGDFGNELGMGAICETVRSVTPAGASCECGCGGVACTIAADVTVASSVSDWGAYAIAAALAHLGHQSAVMMDGQSYRRVLHATVAGGCVDGTSGYAIAHIDGIAEDYHVRLIDMMNDLITYGGAQDRHRPTREYQARRVSAQP